MAPPRLDLYDQRLTPQGRPQPYARPVDAGTSGIGRALAQVGGGLQDVSQALELEDEIKLRREEDDARVYAASALARARAQASELRRKAFLEAPDGWRGATERVSAEWGKLRDQSVNDAPTPISQRFLTQAFDLYQPELLDTVAEEETRARRAWRMDSFREAFRAEGSAIAADPALFEQAAAQQRELIRGLSDLDADDKRDLIAAMDEEFATSAVAALVERDPAAALRALRDPEGQGPYALLSGRQRGAFENQAQAELRRRSSEARADLRDMVNAQNQLMAAGVKPTQPIAIEALERALGPDVAQNYARNLAAVLAADAMTGMSSAAVAQAAAQPIPDDAPDNVRLMTQAARRAAEGVLAQRREDPGEYALRNRLYRHPDLISQLGEAVQSDDWAAFQRALRERGADAVEARRSGITSRTAPLSRGEAAALGAALNSMPAAARANMFSRFAGAMNTEAYVAMMAQIAPENPVTAYAGAVHAQRHVLGSLTGRTIAQRILDGQDLLSPRAEQPGQRPPPAFKIPSNDKMREAWREIVGEAYRGTDQEGAAFEAFRAYYAWRANARGIVEVEDVDRDTARDAANAATGGTFMWNGRVTLAPWGRDPALVERSIRHDWPQYQARHPQLRGRDPGEFDLVARGNGRYEIMDGANILRDAAGNPARIFIRVRDTDNPAITTERRAP